MGSILGVCLVRIGVVDLLVGYAGLLLRSTFECVPHNHEQTQDDGQPVYQRPSTGGLLIAYQLIRNIYVLPRHRKTLSGCLEKP